MKIKLNDKFKEYILEQNKKDLVLEVKLCRT